MVSPECYVDSAEKILQQEAVVEIDFRNAISRAYYGAFHKLFSTVEGTPYGHDDLIMYLKKHKNKELRVLATSLDSLRISRVTADYHMNIHVYDVTAKASLIKARQILNKVDSL